MDNKCKDGTEERQGKSGDVPRISDACFIPAFRVSKWHERELCHLLGISNNTFLFRLQRKVMLFMHKILFFYISFFSSKWWFHKIWDILIQIHYETIQFQRPFFLFLYTIWGWTVFCGHMSSNYCLFKMHDFTPVSQYHSERRPPTPAVDVRYLDPCPRHAPYSALQVTTTWTETMTLYAVRFTEKLVVVRVAPPCPHYAVCRPSVSSTAAL